MIMKSEGLAIKHVKSPPRDKKYVTVAYSRLLAEYAQVIPPEAAKNMASALIELNDAGQATNSFTMASVLNKEAEEMLVDGAIDQTFAFSRSSFIQLTAAKIEHSDKLAQEVPNAQTYMMQCL